MLKNIIQMLLRILLIILIFMDKNQIQNCVVIKKKKWMKIMKTKMKMKKKKMKINFYWFSENFSMIIELFTEIDDCSFYS